MIFLIGQVNRKIIILILISVLSFMFSCKKENIKKEDIIMVRIVYLPKELSTDIDISDCSDIFGYSIMLRDTILEKPQIEKLIELTNKLKTSDIKYPNDFRIRCSIKMKNGEEHLLCMGGYFGTVLDGTQKADSPDLHEFIQEVLFSTQPTMLPNSPLFPWQEFDSMGIVVRKENNAY